MRVISGKLKGTTLYSPKNNSRIRPTSDRVKEAIYSIIGEKVVDAFVLDLYCGSGALGIEALSRGASYAVFVDHNNSSQLTTNKNLEKTSLFEWAKLYKMNVATYLQNVSESTYDLIFMDPPYSVNRQKIEEILKSINKYKWLSNNGLIIYEHSKRQKTIEIEDLMIEKEKFYGDTSLTIYRKELK